MNGYIAVASLRRLRSGPSAHIHEATSRDSRPSRMLSNHAGAASLESDHLRVACTTCCAGNHSPLPTRVTSCAITRWQSSAVRAQCSRLSAVSICPNSASKINHPCRRQRKACLVGSLINAAHYLRCIVFSLKTRPPDMDAQWLIASCLRSLQRGAVANARRLRNAQILNVEGTRNHACRTTSSKFVVREYRTTKDARFSIVS
jgi:hypothetical protein